MAGKNSSWSYRRRPGGIAQQRAEVFRDQVQHLAHQPQGLAPGRVTLSLGIASFPEHGTTAEDLLTAAEAALYRAKAAGRNRCVVAPLGAMAGAVDQAERALGRV